MLLFATPQYNVSLPQRIVVYQQAAQANDASGLSAVHTEDICRLVSGSQDYIRKLQAGIQTSKPGGLQQQCEWGSETLCCAVAKSSTGKRREWSFRRAYGRYYLSVGFRKSGLH